MASNPILNQVRAEISWHLDQIVNLFRKGQNIKLTLIARNADYPDGSHNLLLTSDDLSEVARAIGILQSNEVPTPEAVDGE